MELHKVLSQDREVILGGKTFTMGKFTLNDQSKFDLWICEQVEKEAKKILTDMNKSGDIDAYMKLKYNPDLKTQVSSSTSATLHLIHILISKHSEITYEDFAAMLTLDDLENINKIFDDGSPESDAEKNEVAE